MAGRTPSEAVKAFTAPIQRALTCFADGRVIVDSYKPDNEGVLQFNDADDVRLNGQGRVCLYVSLRYRIVKLEDPPDPREPWKTTTTGWAHHLGRIQRGKVVPIAQFHWHPQDTPDKPYPHVHVPADADRLHIPTGRVLVEDVLKLAIESGATPRDQAKWDDILQTNVENFAKGATWGVTYPPC
jgi:hypothetical protein